MHFLEIIILNYVSTTLIVSYCIKKLFALIRIYSPIKIELPPSYNVIHSNNVLYQFDEMKM